MERNLTTGSVLKNILYFSLPYLLSYFLQTLYGMADLFIVGQFDGVASTTAVSVGSQVMHMNGNNGYYRTGSWCRKPGKGIENSWKYRSIIYGAFCCADGSIAVFR